MVFRETNVIDCAFAFPQSFLLRSLFPAPLPVCGFVKMNSKAITPTKVRGSDVGYDVSIVDLDKVVNDTTIRYTTYLRLDIPEGYYAEIVARSSLPNYGYILSNSVGIIDRSYTGPLLISLTKVSSKAVPVEFPFKCAQIIFKRQEFVVMKQITDLPNRTSRGDKGHGSSG
jgi:dUTP pyrophosphatase